MNTKPFFSVIVPCYNASLYLEEALDSLATQTCQDFEAMLINDGSTDNTLALIKKWQNSYSWIKVISQKNKGLSSARNAGLKKASGKVIAFLDADDLFHKEFLEKNKEFHMMHESRKIAAFGRYTFIAPDRRRLLPYTMGIPRILNIKDFYECPFPPVTVTVRKKHLDAAGEFNESLRTAEDAEMWLKLARTGVEFHPLFPSLSYYRFHSGSMTFSNTIEYLKILDKVTDKFIPEKDLTMRNRAFSKKFLAFAIQCLAAGQNVEASIFQGYKYPDCCINPVTVAEMTVFGITRALLQPWESWIRDFDRLKEKLIAMLKVFGMSVEEINKAVSEIESWEGPFIGDNAHVICENWKAMIPGKKKLAIFGAGRNGLRLLCTLKENGLTEKKGTEIVFLDECIQDGTFQGYPLITPERLNTKACDAILLSSPYHAEFAREKCKKLFTDKIPVLNLFPPSFL